MWTNLINFKELFESWTTNKTTAKTNFKNILSKLTYENGALYFDMVSNITLSEEEVEITYGESLTLTGTHSLGEGCQIKLYQNEVLLEELVTGSGGAFSTTISDLIPGNYTFLFTYEDEIDGVITASCSVVVNKIKTSISLSATKRLFNYTVDVTNLDNISSKVTGILKDEYGNILSEKEILFEESDMENATSSNGELQTDATGKFVLNTVLRGRINTVRQDTKNFLFEGNDFYDECQASIDFYACRLDDYIQVKIKRRVSINYENVLYNSLNEPLIVDYGDGTIELLSKLEHSVTGGYVNFKIYNFIGDMSHIYNLFGHNSYVTNVHMPSSVTNMSPGWFNMSNSLEIVYDLYWDTPPITWRSTYFPVAESIVIPNGTTSSYVEKGFPNNLLVEREVPDDIAIQSNFIEGYSGHVVQRGTSLVFNGQLMKNNTPLSICYEKIDYSINKLKFGESVQSGSVWTDENGQFNLMYLAQGLGNLGLTFVIDGEEISSLRFEDCMYTGWDIFKPNEYKTVTGTTLLCQTPTILDYLKGEISPSDKVKPFSIEMEYVDVTEENYCSFYFGFVKYDFDVGRYLPISGMEGSYDKLEEYYSGGLFRGLTEHVKPVTGDVFMIEISRNSVTIYKNDYLHKLGTKTTTEDLFSGWSYFAFMGDSDNFKQKWKNFKVKVLQ